MASDNELEDLQNAVAALNSIDQDKVLRPGLGEVSLKEEFGPQLKKFISQVAFATGYASQVYKDQVNQLRTIVDGVIGELKLQSDRTPAEYVSYRQAFLNAVGSHIDQLQIVWPHFVTAAIEARGLLQDEGVRKEYAQAMLQMDEQAAATLKKIREQSEKTIAEARQLAEQIEERARRTATKISVVDAQNQFSAAQKSFDKQVRVWGGLSITAVVLFIALGIVLWRTSIPAQTTGEAIYHTAVRITILTAVGAVATFCLRVLRAHLHMQQQNLHRQRVANSMAAFVESAVTPEQRDLILAHLVDAVASFGNSGLLPEHDDSIAPTKLAIDSITRNIITPQK